MLATLRRRDFLLLWVGGLVSLTGSWAMFAALPYFVYERTGSALASGAVLTIEMLPLFLFGSVAGVLVDRWDRKKVLVAANAAQALATLPMLAPSFGGSLWVVYVSAFAISSIGTLVPPAENALLPRLVGRENLMAANSLNSLNDNLARIIGPAVGGLLIATIGLGGVVVDAATFLCAASVIALVGASGKPAVGPERGAGGAVDPSPNAGRELVEGLRLVIQNRFLLGLFVVVGIALLADGLLTVLMVPFIEDVLAADGSVYGLVLAGRGAGGLLGGVLVGMAAGWLRPERLLPASLAVLGALKAMLVVLPAAPVAVAVQTVSGVPAIGWLTSQQTLLQNSVPDRYLGRVFGVFTTVSATAYAGSTLLAGVLADSLGVVPVLYATAALYVVAGLLAFPLLREKPAVET